MGIVRGEKVSFRKADIVCLHDLPSAKAHDPVVLHATDGPGTAGIILRLFGGVAAFAFVIGLLVVAAIEAGFADSTLNARALSALNQAVGPGYRASVERTVLRFSGFEGLALKAENVALIEVNSGRHLATTAAVSIVLDPLALLSGRISASQLVVDGAMIDPSLLPKGGPPDLTALRVSDVPDYLDAAFERLDTVDGMIDRNGLESVRISDLGLPLRGRGDRPVLLTVESLTFDRSVAGRMAIAGSYAIDDQPGEIDLTAEGAEGAVRKVDGLIRGVPLGAFLLSHTPDGAVHGGVDATVDVIVAARREAPDAEPALGLSVTTAGGSFFADGIPAEIKQSELAFAFDFDRGSMEIAPSTIRIGESVFPMTGGFIDLDRISGDTTKGFAIDLLLRGATSAPLDTAEAAVPFNAKASGRYLPATGEFRFDELGLTSSRGNLAGSLALRLGEGSPEISFVMIANRLQSIAVKQFWPYWMAKKAREWVIGNISGGTVTNGQVEVYLPEGRLPPPGEPVELRGDELRISFDIDGARLNVAGDIPPVRDTSGRFELHGERADITITGGTAYFPSGRSVALTGGTFVLPNTYAKPLMGEMDIHVAGNADAIAELATYRPISALQRTGFKPEDFTGSVKANVKGIFGLIRDQDPPPPEWSAAMELSDVDVNAPIEGRKITGVTGSFDVNPLRADIKADAEIDGVPMKVALVEPVDRSSGLTRQFKVSGTLDNADREKLLPGFGDILDGPVGLEIRTLDAGGKEVSADLRRAKVTVPWLGWTKGSGIAATAAFKARTEEGRTTVSDFDFSGDGFAVEGGLTFTGTALDSARFSRISLSGQDRFSLTVERDRAGYAVTANGAVADVRPVLEQLKAGTGSSDGKGSRGNLAIHADIDRMIGFGGEGLSNVKLVYQTTGRRITAFDLSAVTDSGQAVVARLDKGNGASQIELTSGDAGAMARFTDIYRHLSGGLLNVRLRAAADGSWRGSIDVRKFALTGEERLRSIVSTPAGADGRSLTEAVRSEIDTSSVRFDRGFARVRAGQGGTLRVENGVVRGDTVGATFQGTVRDAQGQMDMTGTFMPAYGLNRLFAEVPLIGALLGNGRDRGLLGITFKLTGAFNQPRLTINPLSIIAPGVFRNIFEFQ